MTTTTTGDAGEAAPVLGPAQWDTAAGILREAWGADVTLASAAVLHDRDHVVRLVTTDGRRAVLKRARAEGQGLWGDPDGFRLEWATLEALGEVAAAGGVAPVAPALLGGDREAGVFVMEDLAGPTLAGSLLRPSDGAAAHVTAFAEGLAALHAAGLRDPAAFAAARRRRGAPPTRSRWGLMVAQGRARFTGAQAERLGPVAAPAGLAAELDRVERLLDGDGDAAGRGGDAGGLVHGDPCPDNVLIVDGRARILDYERAGPGATAMDAAYLLAPFPSCWCFAPLPGPVAAAALDAYLAARTAAGAPVGPAWEEELAAALVAPFVMHAGAFALALGSRPAPDDSGPGRDGLPWGTTTTAPRLVTWAGSFLAHPASAAFPHLTAVVGAARDRLAPAVAAATPLAYPAFPAPGATLVASPDGWLPDDWSG